MAYVIVAMSIRAATQSTPPMLGRLFQAICMEMVQVCISAAIRRSPTCSILSTGLLMSSGHHESSQLPLAVSKLNVSFIFT